MIRTLALLLISSSISLLSASIVPCSSDFCHHLETEFIVVERDYSPVNISHRNGVTVLKFGRDPEPGHPHTDDGLLPGADTCGRLLTDRIRAGQPAALYEFPWMAIVRYDGEVHPRCFGTLISKRYVLTAAQCVRRDWKPYQVRLGEYNLGEDRDCDLLNGEDCAPPVKDYDIEEIVEHWIHNAGKNTNDMALIRLKEEVTFEDHIQPICLPTTSDLLSIKLEKYIISGWGWNEQYSTNQIMQKATIRLVDKSTCSFSLNESHLCAGETSGRTCMGDTGVPMGGITKVAGGKMRFVQFGIASRDLNGCSGSGSTIYTNVAFFMDWIRANMVA